MAATLIRQTIKEESPLILQTAAEATVNSTSSSLAIGSMAANAARTAAVASVEAASAAGSTTGILGGVGKMGAEVISKEVGAVAGESSLLSSHLAAVKQTAMHAHPGSSITSTSTTLAETTHLIPQPTITTATSPLNPHTLTSSIAREALTSGRASTGRQGGGSTLARMDLNVAQTAETIKEAISNAIQEGLEEQLDKAKFTVAATTSAATTGTSGPAVASAAMA